MAVMGNHAIEHNVVESLPGIPDRNEDLSRVVPTDTVVMGAMDVEVGQPEVSIGRVGGGARDIDAVVVSADDFEVVDLPSLLAGQLHGREIHSTIDDRLRAGSVGIDDDGGGGCPGALRSQRAVASHAALEKDLVSRVEGCGVDGGQSVPRAGLGSNAVAGGGAIHVGGGCRYRSRSGRGRRSWSGSWDRVGGGLPAAAAHGADQKRQGDVGVRFHSGCPTITAVIMAYRSCSRQCRAASGLPFARGSISR